MPHLAHTKLLLFECSPIERTVKRMHRLDRNSNLTRLEPSPKLFATGAPAGLRDPLAGGFSLSAPMPHFRSTLLAWLCFFVFVASGCSPTPTSTAARPPTRIETTTPVTAATAHEPTTVAPTPSPQPAATSPSCPASGEMERGLVANEGGFGRDLPFIIYLPPCYQQLDQGWPVLYLFHGLAGSPDDWLGLGLLEAADRLMASGESEGFLIVMPWQRTGLEFEAAFKDGLMPQIEDDYRGLPGRTWRAVGGISRGGGWAFRIGFRYQGEFSAIGLHSPAVMAGDLAALPRWRQQTAGQITPRLWIDIGESDSLLGSVMELERALEAAAIEYELTTGAGGHNAAYWSAHLDEYLAWYAARW